MTSETDGGAPNKAPTATEIAASSLRGDIRDAVLAEFKSMPKLWQKSSEDEQERLIRRANDIAEEVVRRAVDIVAEQGLPALPIKVGKFSVDGSDIKGTYECYADDEALLRMRHLAGARAMFVLASPDRYNGERAPAETDVVGELGMPKDAIDHENEENMARMQRTMEAKNAAAAAVAPEDFGAVGDDSNDMRVADDDPDEPEPGPIPAPLRRKRAAA